MPSVYGVDNDVPQKGFGVFEESYSNYGVSGFSNRSTGVRGQNRMGYGVYATSDEGQTGVYGESPRNYGVYGQTYYGYGVYGVGNSGNGVRGESRIGAGVYGYSENNYGVFGSSDSQDYAAVYGHSNSNRGVVGRSDTGDGVAGISETNTGVVGRSLGKGYGVLGISSTSYGVYAKSTFDVGLYATSAAYKAAFLEGRVEITGNLTKGGGRFKIDHPLDPANKYPHHSFVESPDMKNVYDGVVVLDDKDEAEIELPDWFGALNKDFRYQLTAVGAPGPNLYIAEEISEATINYSDSGSSNNNNSSSFKIAGGTSGMKVSWQVTGIRRDPWANANRIEVEEDKPTKERGYYLHPDLYGQPEEKRISHLLSPRDKREEVVARAFHK